MNDKVYGETAKVLKIIYKYFLKFWLGFRPICTKLTGFVYDVVRHKILKFERNRLVGSGKVKVWNLGSRPLNPSNASYRHTRVFYWRFILTFVADLTVCEIIAVKVVFYSLYWARRFRKPVGFELSQIHFLKSITP